MEAIGRLAGGVAHDFNNLLLAINGYSELLADSVDGPEQRRFAEQIRAAGARAAGLTQQLLAFSRRQVLQPRVLDLNDCVREIDDMLARLIGAGIEIRAELAPDLQPVESSEEHTSELQSPVHLVCRLLLENNRPAPNTSTRSAY